ncbi:MAG: glutamate--tRNA ligase [Gammaproteobacteria bacterium]
MIRTRFAPSPTGQLHLGNARTALFNALYAARAGGAFVLRIEDTDATRNIEPQVAKQLADLHWLGLDWSEGPDCGGSLGPYRQSERAAIHTRYLDQLAAENHAYPCFCTPKELADERVRAQAEGRAPRYLGTCARIAPSEARRRLDAGEAATLRFRIPVGRDIVFDDMVHGAQRTASAKIGDFVIRRADGSPAFFFANALDDALMEITHVLRGEDHLTNTPRQLLILEALDLPAPRYGHLPLVLDAEDQPLSKRGGSASLAELRESGILPAALANYLLRLGHATTHAELLDAEARAQVFDPIRLGRAPAHYDAAQLAHWQRLAVHVLAADAAREWTGATEIPNARWADFWALVCDNVTDREDVRAWAEVLTHLPSPDVLRGISPELLDATAEYCDISEYVEFVRELRERTGLGGRKLFQPLRAILTGRHDGPELKRLWTYLTPAERRERFRHARKVTDNAAG